MLSVCAAQVEAKKWVLTVVTGVLAVQVARRVGEGAQEPSAVRAVPLNSGLGHLAVALRNAQARRASAPHVNRR